MFSSSLFRPLAALAAFMAVSACTTGSSSSGTTAAESSSSATAVSAVSTSATGSISLSQATYSVAQSAGTLTVTVNRTGGSSGVVSVSYATADGTAAAGTDYTAASGTLTWQSGDSTAKTFSVSLNTTSAFSGTRSFAITLSDITGGGFLGSPSTATATITGSGTTSGPGALSWSATSYSVSQAAGSLTVTVTRTGGTTGAVNVAYATANGTATAGQDYTATSGTLTWAAGDGTSKTITVPVSNATPFSGTRSFTLVLSAAAGGAALGAPSTATATITGSNTSNPGTLALSTASFSVNQSAGSLTVTATRSGGTVGAVSVAYATANGTATAGKDYTAVSGTLSWAAGDAAVKTFTVAISNATAFSGTKTFTITLSGAGGGAALGTPVSATATITGSIAAACAQSSSSYTTTNAYDFVQYGNYSVQNNNWSGTSGQTLWANSAGCWGVTTTRTTEQYNITSAPEVQRGWSQNGATLGALSTAGTNDWTTTAGMGIAVTALTKAKVKWSFSAAAGRYDMLLDTYFHTVDNPPYSAFYPSTDLMITYAIDDQVLNGLSYYGTMVSGSHGTLITIGGVQFTVYVDNPSQVFNQPGGHTIWMAIGPTTLSTGNAALQNWGTSGVTVDLAAIIKYWMQSNPKDDSGNPVLNASGATITTPMIASNLYLTETAGGFEIDYGTQFTTTGFCVSLQNEPDCP